MFELPFEFHWRLSNWLKVIICPSNGLGPNGRQAIVWTSDDIFGVTMTTTIIMEWSSNINQSTPHELWTRLALGFVILMFRFTHILQGYCTYTGTIIQTRCNTMWICHGIYRRFRWMKWSSNIKSHLTNTHLIFYILCLYLLIEILILFIFGGCMVGMV